MKYKVRHDCESATLAHKPEDPPLKEVRRQIQLELGTHLRSVRDQKGMIDDETEIYEIGCLRKALKLLSRRPGNGRN